MGAPLVPTTTPGVYRRGNRYAVRYTRPDGRKGQRAARTLREARALKAALTADVARGEHRELSRVTFAEYVDTWAATYRGRTGRGVRVHTLVEYRRDLELYAVPWFGRRRLAEIEPQDVKRLAAALAAGQAPPHSDRPWRALGPATVRNVLAPVRALLATAVEEGLIRHNPAAGLRLPGKLAGPEERVKALAPAELEALLGAAPDAAATVAGMPPRLFLRFLADTGLRIGEAIALRWAHVDLAERRVAVRERIYKGGTDAPKSERGRREVPLTSALAADLRAWRLASRYSTDADYVWPTLRGTAQAPSNLARRLLKPAAERAELLDDDGRPWPGFHTLRHTAASRWFRAGFALPVVSRLLGHSDPSFTFRVYVHMLPSDLPDMDRLAAIEAGG
jgi:integrase